MRPIVLLLLFAAPAAADGLSAVEAALSRGDVATATRKFSLGTMKAIAKSPPKAARLCRVAADRAFAFAGSSSTKLLDALRWIADSGLAERTDDAATWHARGEVKMLRARVGFGTAEEVALYPEAADHFEQAHRLAPAQGAPLARAVAALTEYARLAPEGVADPLERVARLRATLEEKHAGSAAAAFAVAAHELAVARRALPDERDRRRVGHIKERLETALEGLRPKAETDLEYATTLNDFVTFVRRDKRLRMKPNFFLRSAVVARGRLILELPISRYWTYEGGDVIQYRTDGMIRRILSFSEYRWHIEYVDGPRGIGGDNPKGLCTADVDDARASFVKIKRFRKPVKGRFNRNIPTGYFFDITGADEDDFEMRIRSWYFKSKKHRTTLNLYMVEFGDRIDDPEGDDMIASVRES